MTNLGKCLVCLSILMPYTIEKDGTQRTCMDKIESNNRILDIAMSFALLLTNTCFIKEDKSLNTFKRGVNSNQ